MHRCSIFLAPEVCSQIASQDQLGVPSNHNNTSHNNPTAAANGVGAGRETARENRRSSCASEWTAGMLEFEVPPESERLSHDDKCDPRDRYASGASSQCAAPRSTAALHLPDTRLFVFARVIDRRRAKKMCSRELKRDGDDGEHCPFSNSHITATPDRSRVLESGATRREIDIVDDKVAAHAALLRFVLT